VRVWDTSCLVDGLKDYNLNGYYSRIKKINQAIKPINQEIIELKTDLLKKKSEKEVADNI
jgi:hypothetical protein